VGEAQARDILRRWRYDKDTITQVAHLIRNHMFWYQTEWTGSAVRRFVRKVGLENIPALFALRRADNIGSGARSPRMYALDALWERVQVEIRAASAFSLRDLAIDGNDVMRELGIAPGPQQVDAEPEKRRSDHGPESIRRQVPRREAAADRARDRRRQHPGDEAPVDPSGAHVRDGGCCGRHARHRDVRARRRRRIRSHEEEDRQPDVAQDEPEEPADEGHGKAPDADTGEDQGLHSLEYPG